MIKITEILENSLKIHRDWLMDAIGSIEIKYCPNCGKYWGGITCDFCGYYEESEI